MDEYNYDFYAISLDNFKKVVKNLYDKCYTYREIEQMINESIIEYLSLPDIKNKITRKEKKFLKKYKYVSVTVKDEDVDVYQRCKEAVSDLYACVNVTIYTIKLTALYLNTKIPTILRRVIRVWSKQW